MRPAASLLLLALSQVATGLLELKGDSGDRADGHVRLADPQRLLRVAGGQPVAQPAELLPAPGVEHAQHDRGRDDGRVSHPVEREPGPQPTDGVAVVPEQQATEEQRSVRHEHPERRESEPDLVETRLRQKLPEGLRGIPIKIDVARHYHRPSGRLPAGGQNFLLDPAVGVPQELNDDELFRTLPISFMIFRVYSTDHTHDAEVAQAMGEMLGESSDTKTNM